MKATKDYLVSDDPLLTVSDTAPSISYIYDRRDGKTYKVPYLGTTSTITSPVYIKGSFTAAGSWTVATGSGDFVRFSDESVIPTDVRKIMAETIIELAAQSLATSRDELF